MSPTTSGPHPGRRVNGWGGTTSRLSNRGTANRSPSHENTTHCGGAARSTDSSAAGTPVDTIDSLRSRAAVLGGDKLLQNSELARFSKHFSGTDGETGRTGNRKDGGGRPWRGSRGYREQHEIWSPKTVSKPLAPYALTLGRRRRDTREPVRADPRSAAARHPGSPSGRPPPERRRRDTPGTRQGDPPGAPQARHPPGARQATPPFGFSWSGGPTPPVPTAPRATDSRTSLESPW